MNSARLARKWQEAKGDFAQMAETLNDELLDDVASKADLRATESTLRSEIADLRADIHEHRQETRAEFAEVRTEIEAVRTEITAVEGRLRNEITKGQHDTIKWVAGLMFVQMAAMLAIVRLLMMPGGG